MAPKQCRHDRVDTLIPTWCKHSGMKRRPGSASGLKFRDCTCLVKRVFQGYSVQYWLFIWRLPLRWVNIQSLSRLLFADAGITHPRKTTVASDLISASYAPHGDRVSRLSLYPFAIYHVGFPRLDAMRIAIARGAHHKQKRPGRKYDFPRRMFWWHRLLHRSWP